MYAPVQGNGVPEAGTLLPSAIYHSFIMLPHPIVIRGDLIAHKAAHVLFNLQVRGSN